MGNKERGYGDLSFTKARHRPHEGSQPKNVNNALHDQDRGRRRRSSGQGQDGTADLYHNHYRKGRGGQVKQHLETVYAGQHASAVYSG